ncbi:hypothetical protein [Tateyamaria omphalii]|uniref:hypothetical protein n=1 Tax=Tateyamaria omphalii TaxID=299262 RepID=UPI0016739094|nr:hypothetical protein [Tateyamaria omphalii]
MTDAQIQTVQNSVTHNFKDPNSAQFRKLRWFENRHADGTISNTVCGEVNAKNSFGGFVGFSPFAGRMNGGQFVLYGVARPGSIAFNSLCPV